VLHLHRARTCAVGNNNQSKCRRINKKTPKKRSQADVNGPIIHRINFSERIDRLRGGSMQIWRQSSAGGSGSQSELQYGRPEWGVFIHLMQF